MTNEPEQPSLFEDTLWGEAFGDLAAVEPIADGQTPSEPAPAAAAGGLGVPQSDEPEVHPDQPSLYEHTQPDLTADALPPAAAQPAWSRTGTPGRAAPTAPRSVLTTQPEPTQELPRTVDNVVPLRPAAPTTPAATPPTSAPTPPPGASTQTGPSADAPLSAPAPSAPATHVSGPVHQQVRWAAVVMFVGEVAWLVLISMIGWRLGSGWPIGAVTAAVLLGTFTAVWGTWLAPKASRRLVAEDRNVVLIFIGSIITVLGAWVGLLAPTLAASLVVIVAHTLDHKLAQRRAVRQASGD